MSAGPDGSHVAPSTLPQDVLAPLTSAAIFLVATVDDGGEDDVLGLFADLAALQRAVGFREPSAGLTCVTGIGSAAWDRLFGGPRPAELHEFVALDGGRHRAPSTPGDLLFHLRAARMDLCFELATKITGRLAGAATIVDEVHGFSFFDQRDLMGFVDGTENPVGDEAREAVMVGSSDPDFSDGSYVIVQKYLHDMDAWNALPVEAQEHVIGRTKLDNIELPDDEKPADSHLALNVIEDDDGNELKILRDNMPFGNLAAGEFGTYYIAYSGTPSVTERMLRNMFIGDPPGTTDRILDFSTAITGGLFFVPPAEFLEEPPAPGENSAEEPGAEPDSPAESDEPPEPAGPADGSLGIGDLKRRDRMNNLYRELAPISSAAWAEIEEEAKRTFERHVAGRRVVDVIGPKGLTLAAVDTGHIGPVDAPDGVSARLRQAQPVVELRVPFTVSRQAVDDVERGAKDSDWQPVKDAARKIAFAEDRAIFEGYAAAGIAGIRASSSNPVIALPGDVRQYPEAVAKALSALRLAGVNGPYSLALSADAYTEVNETTDHGYPILQHLGRVLDGDIVWAPAIDGAFLLSARGGDFELHLGQDLSIGYLTHDAETVQLYFQESLTFLVQADEAAVSFTA